MDPRLRLQHGLVVDQSGQVVGRGGGGLAGLSPYSLSLLQSQLSSERARQDLAAQNRAQATANALRATSGFVPSLSSGQGFYTVESLQGATSVGQDGLVGHSQLPSHDASRAYAGGYLGAGQQGIDAATYNQLLAHQAASQKLLATAPSAGMAPLLLPSHHSVPMEVNTGGIVGRGAGKGGPVYVYQPYAQPEIPVGSARYVQQASGVPAETILRMREREREREEERVRERERDRDRTRDRDRRDEWARERRRDSDRRRDLERRRELDRRRDIERKRDIQYEARSKDRLKQRDTGFHNKKALQASPVTLRNDNMKSKGLQARGQKEKAWCSLCQVDCNTQEMLGRHLEGKKHKSRVEAEAQKELSKKPENVETNKGGKVTEVDKVENAKAEEQVEKGGATASLEAKKANLSKGKVNAKVNTRKKKSKSSKPGSKADTSIVEVSDKLVLNKTVKEPEKVETEATTDKVEIAVTDFSSEEQLKAVEVENIEEVREEKGDEIMKAEDTEEVIEANMASKLEGGEAKSHVPEFIQETVGNAETVENEPVTDFDMVKDEEQAVASVMILEDTANGTDIVEEVSNGNAETKALPYQDIFTSIRAQSQGKESVLGKRNVEVDGEPPSAKKIRKLKNKGADVSPTVQIETVRCEVCKVTCRNAVVYETHLKGEKHTERLKKVQIPTSKTAKTTKIVDNKVADEASPSKALNAA